MSPAASNDDPNHKPSCNDHATNTNGRLRKELGKFKCHSYDDTIAFIEAPIVSPDANGNLIGGPVHGVIDPLLGPLADNGGTELPDGSRILTHALLAGSPAINAGDLSAVAGEESVPEFDQRGEPFARIVGGRIDIGAFEYQTPTDLNLLVDTLEDESNGNYSRGDLSLREAIELANATSFEGVIDTIRFDPALWANGPATILLTQGELKITDSLTIDGPRAELLTVDASGNDPTPDDNNGDGSRVFNIDNGNFATLLRVSISGLTITGGDTSSLQGGGAIYARASLSIVACQISGNAASETGGGVRVLYGEVTVANSTISNNSARFGGGVSAIDLTVSNCEINNNTATLGGGGLSSSGKITVTGSTIRGNLARVGGGISGTYVTVADSETSGNVATDRGGGIRGGIIRVIRSTISGNTANSGGGIYGNSSVTVEGCTISDNSAVQDGGGVHSSGSVTVLSSRVSENQAGRGGGAIVAYGGVLVTSSTLSNNTGGIVGGGIRASGNVMVTSSTISGNSAGAGGGINAHGAMITVIDSVVKGNSATYGGGLLGEVVKVIGSTISGNQATGDGGGVYSRRAGEITGSSISNNTANGDGGGVAALGTLKVIGSTVSDNTAVGRGGGIFTDRYSSAIDIMDSTISGNSAAQGGGVCASFTNAWTISIVRSTVTANSATFGGGLFLTIGSLELDHSIVAKNWGSVGPDLTGLIGVDVDARFSLVGDNRQSGLVESSVGLPDAKGNLIGGPVHGVIDPLLGPLADNGGFELPDGSRILTHVLLPGSPAINAGDPMAAAGADGVPVHDQRGAPFTRVFGGRIDIGAVESIPVGVLPGDYNDDGVVDAADYTVWRDAALPGFLSEGVSADGNGDGAVDELDYAVWKANFGSTMAALATGSGEATASTRAESASASPAATESELGIRFQLPFDSSMRTAGQDSLTRRPLVRETNAFDVRQRAGLLAWLAQTHSAAKDRESVDGEITVRTDTAIDTECGARMEIVRAAFALWDR